MIIDAPPPSTPPILRTAPPREAPAPQRPQDPAGRPGPQILGANRPIRDVALPPITLPPGAPLAKPSRTTTLTGVLGAVTVLALTALAALGAYAWGNGLNEETLETNWPTDVTIVMMPRDPGTLPGGERQPAGGKGTAQVSEHHLETGTNTFMGATDAFIADIDAWWRTEFPRTFGDQYVALEQGVWPGSHSGGFPDCGEPQTYEDVQGNAFYCFQSDYIAYDDLELFPDYAATFGIGSLGIILAHEWGHAIQARTYSESDVRNASGIVVELQADCYAGAWAAHSDSELYLGTEGIRKALSGMITFADPKGSDATDENAHGSAFDRINAFREGYEDGTAACKMYTTTPPETFQLPWSSWEDQANDGDLPLTDLLPAVAGGLQEYAQLTRPGYTVSVIPSYQTSGYSCPVEGVASWCAQLGAIVVNETAATELLSDIGDMAVGFAVAEALFALNPDPVCAADSWMSWVYRGTLDQSGTYTLSPGDIDEVVEYLLATRAPTLRGAFDELRKLELVMTTGVC